MPLLLDLRDKTFADQSRILSRHGLPALGSTRRLSMAETRNPPSPVQLSASRRLIDEICDQRAARILIEIRTEFSETPPSFVSQRRVEKRN